MAPSLYPPWRQQPDACATTTPTMTPPGSGEGGGAIEERSGSSLCSLAALLLRPAVTATPDRMHAWIRREGRRPSARGGSEHGELGVGRILFYSLKIFSQAGGSTVYENRCRLEK